MDPDLMDDEEVELISLILLVPQSDGSYLAEDTNPERCAELRSILADRYKDLPLPEGYWG